MGIWCYKSLHSSVKAFHIPTFWNLTVGICTHVVTRALVRSTTEVWLTISIPVHSKWGWGRASVQASQVFLNSEKHFFIDLAFCTFYSRHKVGGKLLSKISFSAVTTIAILFKRNKRAYPKLGLEKKPQSKSTVNETVWIIGVKRVSSYWCVKSAYPWSILYYELMTSWGKSSRWRLSLRAVVLHCNGGSLSKCIICNQPMTGCLSNEFLSETKLEIEAFLSIVPNSPLICINVSLILGLTLSNSHLTPFELDFLTRLW